MDGLFEQPPKVARRTVKADAYGGQDGAGCGRGCVCGGVGVGRVVRGAPRGSSAKSDDWTGTGNQARGLAEKCCRTRGHAIMARLAAPTASPRANGATRALEMLEMMEAE